MLFSMNDWEDLVNDNLKTKEEEKLEILLFFFFYIVHVCAIYGRKEKKRQVIFDWLEKLQEKEGKKK